MTLEQVATDSRGGEPPRLRPRTDHRHRPGRGRRSRDAVVRSRDVRTGAHPTGRRWLARGKVRGWRRP